MNRKELVKNSGSLRLSAGNLISADFAAGFSLVELIISMLVTLIILGAGVAAFTSNMRMRTYEINRTDALASTQAAINIMSREIGNSGFGLAHNDGLETNGLVFSVVFSDCNDTRLHFRANTNNSNFVTSDPGEDVTFYYDAATQSVVRYDKATNTKSGIINQVSQVQFTYWNYDYNDDGLIVVSAGTASEQTARITIRLTVLISGDGNANSPRNVKFESDIALRNSQYGLGRY